MYRFVTWLVYRLPAGGYDEADDTSWVSWTSRCGLSITITYWPLDYVCVHFWRWSRSWAVGD